MSAKRLHALARNGLVASAVALAERLDRTSPSILRVLTYHRVDAPQPFAAQLEHLVAHYRPVSVTQVLAALDGGPALPRRSVLVTFDDAYRNFATVAWPELARRSIPAVLFVPTAFPGRALERFWWDSLAEAFARTTRREPLPTPVGLLALASASERARAHRAVKLHVKGLAHEETLALTRQVCAALGVAPGPHEVLDWDELRQLAAAGVTLGAHSRTHPRLDRVPRAVARAEILDSVRELEREVACESRVFAYPDGRFDDELVEVARGAGIELAFTTRRGTNQLFACDPLRLRRIPVDAAEPLEVLRAKLALGSAWLAPLRERVLERCTPAERSEARAARRARRRTRLLWRTLDAALTARLRPKRGALTGLALALTPGRSHYERVGELAAATRSSAPGLGRRLDAWLLEDARCAFADARLEVLGFGSGTTVFRLEQACHAPLALKVYRRTLGREPAHLARAARRYRLRYERLARTFGELVLPAEFLVLHTPLRGLAAVVCVQPLLTGRMHDLLALADDELVALLARHGLSERFAEFSRRTLAWHARGASPDLLGRGNLVLVEEQHGARLLLIDYGGFRHAELARDGVLRRTLDELAARLESLLERSVQHDVLVNG